MRCLALAVLGACSFSAGVLPADAPGGDTRMIDAPDDTEMVMADVAPDGFVSGDTVRMIDLVDAKITGAPHTDFPLLVTITATYLKSKTNAGDVNRDDGFDIYFSADQAGATRLSHEVEVYDPVAGSLIAWVKIPSLVATTVLYLHYGNTTITTSQENAIAVWSNGYELVLHLDGGGDATGKSGTNTGSNLGNSTGIGPARSFNGTDSYATVGSGAAVDNIFAAGGMVEGWFYATSYGENSRGRILEKGDNGWQMFVVNDSYATASISFVHNGSTMYGQWYAPDNSVGLNAWHHIAVDYDKDLSGNDPTAVLDGSPVTMSEGFTPSGTMSDDSSYDQYLGNNATGSRTFSGTLDELRMSSVTRTADWVGTQYRNESDPATFYTVSAPL